MNYIEEVKEIKEQAIQDFNDSYRKILDIFDANAQSDAVKKFLKAVREFFENDVRKDLKYELISAIIEMQLVDVKVGDVFVNDYKYRIFGKGINKFAEYGFNRNGYHGIEIHTVNNIVDSINYCHYPQRQSFY